MKSKSLQSLATGNGKGAGDFFNFIFSHHPARLWNDKCFSIHFAGSTFHACARCLGALAGILPGTMLFFMLGAGSAPTMIAASYASYIIAFIFPLPAFIHWSFLQLKGWREKTVGFLTGILLGASVPAYYMGLFSLSPAFILGAAFYLLFFMLIIRKRE